MIVKSLVVLMSACVQKLIQTAAQLSFLLDSLENSVSAIADKSVDLIPLFLTKIFFGQPFNEIELLIKKMSGYLSKFIITFNGFVFDTDLYNLKLKFIPLGVRAKPYVRGPIDFSFYLFVWIFLVRRSRVLF